MTTPRDLLTQAAALPTDATATPTDALAVALAREFAWTRACIATLAVEVDKALAYITQRGGQHAGTPLLAGCSRGALLVLQREIAAAQGGAPDHVALRVLIETGDLS